MKRSTKRNQKKVSKKQAPKRGAKKTAAKTLKVETRLMMNPLLPIPTPTSISKCPRCGVEHLKLETRKLTNPIQVGGRVAEHWAPCPTNGEPVIFFRSYVRPFDVEKAVMDSLVEQVASEIDKQVLADLFKSIDTFQKTAKAESRTYDGGGGNAIYTVTYTGKDTDVWAYTVSTAEPELALAVGPDPKPEPKAESLDLTALAQESARAETEAGIVLEVSRPTGRPLEDHVVPETPTTSEPDSP